MKVQSLKKFDFAPKGGAKKSQYDWDKLLDGGIYRVSEGEDGYTCKQDGFVMMVKSRAASRGQEVNVQKDGDSAVVLQATSEPDEAKGEAYKQHQRDLNKARKEKAKAESNGEAEE